MTQLTTQIIPLANYQLVVASPTHSRWIALQRALLGICSDLPRNPSRQAEISAYVSQLKPIDLLTDISIKSIIDLAHNKQVANMQMIIAIETQFRNLISLYSEKLQPNDFQVSEFCAIIYERFKHESINDILCCFGLIKSGRIALKTYSKIDIETVNEWLNAYLDLKGEARELFAKEKRDQRNVLAELSENENFKESLKKIAEKGKNLGTGNETVFDEVYHRHLLREAVYSMSLAELYEQQNLFVKKDLKLCLEIVEQEIQRRAC